eukprot:CAMPEP_0119260176 /NCGR_PEP_ID=MMETSP1329-20130426/689_1 /TAXON_ID=114041 /ORGANISM="Genus nov. species nov., Strain RCC1024" /LENGTH=527 /DNA_ID=CAMNT_0007259597 /DNA_START=314 /DNA_END=1898 /DNA_ORIENTATION=-
MRRRLVDKDERPSKDVELQSFASESQTTVTFRREAYRRCTSILRESFDASVASLTHEVADTIAVYLTAAVHGEEARVAVVTAGFCARSRDLATSALTEALQRRSVGFLEVNVAQPATCKLIMASAKNVWPGSGHAVPQMVLIIGDGEKSDVDVLREVLAGLVCAHACAVLITTSMWQLPAGLPTGVRVQGFQFPALDSFANAFLGTILVRMPVGIGANTVDAWLTGFERHADPAALLCHVTLAVLEHFQRPGAFLAYAIWVDNPVARQLALDEALYATVSSDNGSNPAVRAPTSNLTPLFKAMRQQAAASRLALEWAIVALGGSPMRRWRVSVSAALPSAIGPVPTALARAAADTVISAIRHTVTPALVTLLHNWCARANASPLVDALPRALRAKVEELAALAAVPMSSNTHGLAEEAADLFESVAACGRSLCSLPFSALVLFDDTDSVCRPFAGDLWTATMDTLSAAQISPVSLTFQIAAGHLNVDAHHWYKSAWLRGQQAPCNHCTDSRSAEFAKVVRDLHLQAS